MKRALEEFTNVSPIGHTAVNVKIHGVVKSLSPMKKSRTCSYIDGYLCDGKASVHFDSASNWYGSHGIIAKPKSMNIAGCAAPQPCSMTS